MTTKSITGGKIEIKMKYPQAGALLQELPMGKVLYITFGSLPSAVFTTQAGEETAGDVTQKKADTHSYYMGSQRRCL